MDPSLPQCIGDDLADGSAVSMQIQPLIARNEFSKIVSSSENLKKKRWPSSRILLMISCISSCLSKINWDNFHLSFHASIKNWLIHTNVWYYDPKWWTWYNSKQTFKIKKKNTWYILGEKNEKVPPTDGNLVKCIIFLSCVANMYQSFVINVS